jgi:hypothetical protein
VPEIRWDINGSILTVAAERTLGSVLRRLEDENADWVVVVRTLPDRDEVYYYAFRSAELRMLATQSPERKTLSMQHAMDMHEWTSSGTTRGRRAIGPGHGQQGPASGRVVDFDARSRIVQIGEWEDRIVRTAGPELPSPAPPPAWDEGGSGREVEDESMDDLDPEFDLGPVRGRGGESSGPHGLSRPSETAPGPPSLAGPAGEIEVTLSAETNAEIQVGANEVVNYQIELASEAAPLASSLSGKAQPDLPIVVSLSVENGVLEILEKREHTVDPPTRNEPRKGKFIVKGVRAGLTRLAVTFRQGGSQLGAIGLAVEVVDGETRSLPAQGKSTAAPRRSADDDRLLLTVEQESEAGQVFYEYLLYSSSLSLVERLRSKPLLDKGGGLAESTLKFVERIYERVTRELPSHGADLGPALTELRREARALGVSLCQELFDPDVAKVLWPRRNQISLVQVVSWEPYIPWELVRLRDPVSGDIDERFLAEYGLIRTLQGETSVRELSMAQWGYLGAMFPTGALPSVGAEMDYFTRKSKESIHARGIIPTAIGTTRESFYDALAEGAYDVLHISCHAESRHESIEDANLIIGEETAPGSGVTKLVEVDTITVEAEAKLKKRRPLVFLNACETGRIGAVLTAWGGWPNVFLRAGAGAFVGSAWAVRDKPAAAFATTFYNTMLDGKTLAEAANAARASAKKLGDVSWLAFKVYGDPGARRV